MSQNGDAPFAIEVSHLVKSFDTFYALRSISLNVESGECAAILGPNGAGKSTFLRILASISRPTSGEILINGVRLKEQKEAISRQLGMVGHQTFLYDNLTAAENLTFYARLYDVASHADQVQRLLSEVGLSERAHDRVRGFSRGMQQRLAIARAMLHSPSILLLDEPYTGLDQHAATMLTNWIQKLRSKHHTVLLVTHDLRQALAMADRVIILIRGKIAWERPTADIVPDRFQAQYFDVVAGGEA